MLSLWQKVAGQELAMHIMNMTYICQSDFMQKAKKIWVILEERWGVGGEGGGWGRGQGDGK